MRHQQKIHRSGKESCFILKRETVADSLATVHAAVELDYDPDRCAGDRSVPGTDMEQTIAKLFREEVRRTYLESPID